VNAFEADAVPAPRSPVTLGLIVVLGALGVAALVALGTWQLHRRAWKLDLIQRIENRVHAPPVAAPGRAEWPTVTASTHEYRRVRATGVFLHERETLVRASTELGFGFWVLTPLRTPDGTLVLVNRGFVPPERRDPATRAAGQIAGETTVTGLLRMTEPGGAFLRANDPSADRWYARDVAAIAAARGLGDVAPYFIDADAASSVPDGPVGGLTVIAFHNNHLIYAITWYALAMMLAGATAYIVREQGRLRRVAAGQS
jgi:surfeit locus 1 family protein